MASACSYLRGSAGEWLRLRPAYLRGGAGEWLRLRLMSGHGFGQGYLPCSLQGAQVCLKKKEHSHCTIKMRSFGCGSRAGTSREGVSEGFSGFGVAKTSEFFVLTS